VMNFTANAILAAGASPVMAYAAEEVTQIAASADALVLNIGTLTPDRLKAMLLAGKSALENKKPVVLDPVGAGAVDYRTLAAKQIIDETKPNLIRGNASEILALQDKPITARGVDTAHSVTAAAKSANKLALKLSTSLAITGPTDFITDGTRMVEVQNGHRLMARVTGAGCTATAIMGAFLSVNSDPLCAAACALAYFGLAGEMAAEKASGPGSFVPAFIDALYLITPEALAAGCRIKDV